MSNRHVAQFNYEFNIFILGETKMNDKTNLKVALYMRYSSDKQSEQSIEGQERVCSEFCKRNGYTIIRKYIDRATSAFKDAEKRLQFQKMIKDSSKGDFAGVVVYKLDRFARNRYDSAIYETKLEKNGVKLISATENISDSPEGIILKSVLVGMAQFYSEELSQKINRGLRETALKGNVTGGATPLGYKTKNKKYILDEAAAPIVKEAFELYDKSVPIKEICEIFNAKGYKTVRGGKFNKGSFHRMFKNTMYIGTYSYKDIILENKVPAIVDKALFERVQKRLEKEKRQPTRGKAKQTYLLLHKLYCANCGAMMIGEAGTGKSGKVHYYYYCDSAKRKKGCDAKRIKKNYIEDIVFEQALKLLTPETIDELATMAVKECRRAIEEDTQVPALNEEIKIVDKKINNLLKFFEDGSESVSARERIAELEREKEDLEIRIEHAKNEFVYLEKDHVAWWLNRFTKGDKKDENFKRNILNLLVNSVTVKETKKGYRLVIAYNLNSSNQQTFECSTTALSGGALATYTNTFHYYGSIYVNTCHAPLYA